MKHVTSTHNQTYKNLKRLATSAKHRRRSSQTLVEGIHLCESYLQHGGYPLECIYTDSAADNPEVAGILRACEKLSVPVTLLGEANYKAISSVENGVGLMFVIATPNVSSPKNLSDNALLLDGVQDPGNMGTILRTAAAANVTDIYISNSSSSAWSPKALRAGMGAHFVIDIHERCDLRGIIVNSEVQILATSLDAKETIYDRDLSKPTAWLFGSEGSGVSSDLLSLDVQRVVIPHNQNVESLNVAASVAVCLFEQYRQSS